MNPITAHEVARILGVSFRKVYDLAAPAGRADPLPTCV